MTKPSHWLLVSGSVAVPSLNIALWAQDEKDAIRQAKKIAESLESREYFTFNLYHGETVFLGRIAVSRAITSTLHEE